MTSSSSLEGSKEIKKGFKRSFEHVDGNWPSHVYLRLNTSASKLLKWYQRECLSHYYSTHNHDDGIDEKVT